ncbi:MAG: RidA family protein [Thermoanaerobaculia bacterium]
MKYIETKDAPKAIGPYSQAVKVDRFLFLSGQLPIKPETGELIRDNFKEEVLQVLNNIEAILKSLGCSRKDIVKTTVFLKDMNNFPEFNETYAEFFVQHKPARSTVEVARLPKDARIEIEAIALVP